MQIDTTPGGMSLRKTVGGGTGFSAMARNVSDGDWLANRRSAHNDSHISTPSDHRSAAGVSLMSPDACSGDM
jgi:hypothetical protein